MNILVHAKSLTATVGTLEMNGLTFDCTLGRAGVIRAEEKVEGDGKTPLGRFSLRYLLYRADRVPRPETGLYAEVLTPETGWCEDPAHRDYNRKIALPHPSVHDRMTRDDHLYDYVVIIGYNDTPPKAGKGSAIFLHLARDDFSPTAGCIGLRPKDMLAVLKQCGEGSSIEILLDI